MTQLQKYIWLIENIRRTGRISFNELSDRWERNKDLSDYRPLPRTTFNRWKDAIELLFGINICCQHTTRGYLYYIENPDEIDKHKVKKWMIDSFATGNLIGENLSLKDRILVEETPSGYDHLASILTAMKENKVLNITYRSFQNKESRTFDANPYCVKLFEKRWYVLTRREDRNAFFIYALDRIQHLDITDKSFSYPKDFSADEYFADYFGVVTAPNKKPERIVLRAYHAHKSYMESLPLHHSQRRIGGTDDYDDFELYLTPTYDFVMRLLHVGAMIEVRQPLSLRHTMKGWITDMAELYEND